MSSLWDGLAILVFGLVFLVFHRPLGSFVLETNAKLFPTAGTFMKENTDPRVMIFPAIGFIAFGVLLMLRD
ncbi:hypothetical protein HNR11_002723 [Nesterenkonia sandarakina]|uniref:DUF3995 domain-containing protein n=1 Tax=Nesterenkonia sandarakina TaxID=272918 RepID=A0A7Z0EAT6_9MICC|nr:hypothetical protein [Nesterenkonia sandarakina]